MIPEKFLSHLNKYPAFKALVVKSYLWVVPTIFMTRANFNLMKGSFHAATGNKSNQYREFLAGASRWGEKVKAKTKTNVVRFNEVAPPKQGHLIFLNHVNELDFPFDCMVIHKPYLANQTIKQSLFAYWWMRAMGSQVFDSSKARTIAVSVRNVIEGLSLSSYIVYPEGHNSYSEEVKPLKKGMIKLAYDNKIPVYVVVKSGLTSLHEKVKGNTIGYRACGLVDPNNFNSWEELRDHVHELMTSNKKRLDEEVAASVQETASV